MFFASTLAKYKSVSFYESKHNVSFVTKCLLPECFRTWVSAPLASLFVFLKTIGTLLKRNFFLSSCCKVTPPSRGWNSLKNFTATNPQPHTYILIITQLWLTDSPTIIISCLVGHNLRQGLLAYMQTYIHFSGVFSFQEYEKWSRVCFVKTRISLSNVLFVLFVLIDNTSKRNLSIFYPYAYSFPFSHEQLDLIHVDVLKKHRLNLLYYSWRAELSYRIQSYPASKPRQTLEKCYCESNFFPSSSPHRSSSAQQQHFYEM